MLLFATLCARSLAQEAPPPEREAPTTDESTASPWSPVPDDDEPEARAPSAGTDDDPADPAEDTAPLPIHPVWTQAADAPDLSLVWTGGNRGIGSGSYRFTTPERLQKDGNDRVAEVRPVHGWLVQDDFLITADSHRVEDVLTLLGGNGPQCELAGTAGALSTATEHLITLGPLPTWTADWPGKRREVDLWTCTTGETTGVLIGRKGAALPTSWNVTTWEFRLGLELTTTERDAVHLVGIPAREGTRLFATLAEAAAPGVLYLDAGDFVDGASSVRNDALSLHRPAAFGMLRRLQPGALAPGAQELAGGARAFLDEAVGLPYIASNWRAKDPALQLPDRRIVEVATRNGTVRVGVVAALDPELVHQVPLMMREGIELAPPVAALQPVIDALRSDPEGIDLVVLLTTLRGGLLTDLHTRLTGVDLILGDVGTRPDGIELLELQLASDGPAPVLPVRGIVRAGLTLKPGGGIGHITAQPLPISLSTAPDPRTLAAVSAVRAREYPAFDHPLLPSPPNDPHGVLPGSTWEKVVCEAVLDATDADLALLPALPTDRTVPGALTELVVGGWLATGDHVEVHTVLGSRLPALLDRLYGNVPITCGTELGVKFPKARGRPLEDERIYRIVTTDRLREATALGSLIQTARSPWKLDQPGYRELRAEEGGRATLRSVTLDALRELREDHGPEVITELTGRSSSDKPPQWLLRVREAALKVEGFQGADDPAYADVPETLVTSPSSFTIGSGLDVALDYSSASLNWDLRGRSAFTRLRTAGESQETADDIKVSSSANLPGIATPPVLGLVFSPFTEALLDSEWTPVDATVPRQADASLTLGLALKRMTVLRVLRFGVLGNKDLAVFGKRPEIGARLEAQTRVAFGPGLVWTNQLDGFYFGDTADQDASDLRFKVQLDSRVALPFTRWLSISLYGTGFAFQGRVDATRQVRWSGSLGAALDVTGAFALLR